MNIQRIEKYDDNNKCFVYIIVDHVIYKEDKKKGQIIVGPPLNAEFKNLREPNYKSEIFISNIPKYFKEMNLIPLMSKVGVIFTMKMFYTFADENRGYAFVKFINPDTAQKALALMHNFKVTPKSRLRISMSVNNNIVFIGNLNANRYTLIYIEAIIKTHAKNVRRFCVYAISVRYRYSVTVEFFDHTDAAVFRRDMISRKDDLFSPSVILNWYGNAVPQTQMIADKWWYSRSTQDNPVEHILDRTEYFKLNLSEYFI